MTVGGGVSLVALRTGITVAYELSGSVSAPPVLLVHAWAESSGVFDRLRPLLPKSLMVVTFDQRGHGASDKPGTGYDLPTVADDALALLEVLDLPPTVVVGTSSGGYVAQQLAVAHPERVAGLVLVGAPRSLQGRPPFLDEVAQLTDPIDPEWMRASLEWFPRFQQVPDWFVDDRVQDGLACPARVHMSSLLGLIDAVPPTQVGTITAPTVIIWGERDALLPRADADLLHAAIPDSRLVVLSDTGHLVLWEQPAQVASEVMSLIERVRGCL
jgi:rifampin ADP-ribosylating transferase